MSYTDEASQAPNVANSVLYAVHHLFQELEWDNELAAVAQRWAEQCAFGHDTNRDVGRFKVGQNVYQTTRSRDQPLEDMIQAGIMGWYDEVKDFSGREVTNYR